MRSLRSLQPLRTRSFRLLAGGQLASNIGDMFYGVALPWYVLATHGGPLLLGTVLAAYGIPRTLLLAFGGRASDRWHPWRAMMLADIARALGAGALCAVASSGPAEAATLVPIAALLGAGAGLFLPASYAIAPVLLPEDELQAGNGLLIGATQLSVLVGPAIGGILVAATGSGPAFGLDGASFVVSAATLAVIGRSARVRRSPSGPAAGTAAQTPGTGDRPGEAPPPCAAAVQAPVPGVLALLRSERVLQVILAVTLAANLGSGAMSEVALPDLAHGPLHAGASGYGILLAAFGAGALAGTLLAGQLDRLGRPAVVASWSFALSGVAIAIVPAFGVVGLSAAALVVVGVLNGFGNVLTITAFQRWAPPAILGRLMGVLMLASTGIFPVSVLLGGLVAHRWGPGPVFPIAGGILIAAVLYGLSQPAWRSFGAPPSGRGGDGLADETPAGIGPDDLLAPRPDADQRDRDLDEVGDELEVVTRRLREV